LRSGLFSTTLLSMRYSPLRLVDGDKRPARSVRLLEKLEVVRLRK